MVEFMMPLKDPEAFTVGSWECTVGPEKRGVANIPQRTLACRYGTNASLDFELDLSCAGRAPTSIVTYRIGNDTFMFGCHWGS